MQPEPSSISLSRVSEDGGRVIDEIERVIVGKRDVLQMVLVTFLAGGHVLLEDYPGLAKTLMARSFAQVMDLDFARVQFTPDLMPMDVTGSAMPRSIAGDLEFRPGPIFTNLLLGDEINRAPPKTQAALLEAMEERQVTIDASTRSLGPPFLVIATQNPVEYEGTYPLPEAQLDRFLTRIGVGYPTPDEEWSVLQRRMERRTDETPLSVIVDREAVISMQRAVEDVHVAEAVGRYMVELVVATRSHRNVSVGASPRGSLALMKLSRSWAALEGRDFVAPDDVKRVAVAALAHRIILRPELWVQDLRPAHVVEECLNEVPAPSAPARRALDP